MRTRTTSGPQCPIIVNREYAWNKASSPYQESFVAHPFDNPIYYNWTVPQGYVSLYESIQDDTGNDGRFRDCLHTVETNEFYGPTTKHRFNRGWGGNAYLRSVSSTFVNGARNSRVAPSIDMNAMADEALAFMLPRLNENTSLVNSILELKDLKHANPTGSMKRVLKRNLALRQLRDPKQRSNFIRETTTRLNNAHLNAQFGIVPFVRDVVGIHDDLVALEFRLRQLKENAGKPQVRHYKRVIPSAPGQPASRSWKAAENTASWQSDLQHDMTSGGTRPAITILYRGRWILRPVYHATVRYFYTLPEMDSQHEKVLAYLDVLGVRLDPSIVWNAIPFSFVVDWVADVSGFLGSFARDNYPIEVVVKDFCHSYAWHKEHEVHLTYTNDSVLNSNPNYIGELKPGWIQVYKGMNTYYNRVRHRPDIHTVRLKAPKLRQAALAGSLLLARTSFGNAKGYLQPPPRTLPRKRNR